MEVRNFLNVVDRDHRSCAEIASLHGSVVMFQGYSTVDIKCDIKAVRFQCCCVIKRLIPIKFLCLIATLIPCSFNRVIDSLVVLQCS